METELYETRAQGALRPPLRRIGRPFDVSYKNDGVIELSAELPGGYHQISVAADASDWDWEGMYFPLHLFGNSGQLTGPWDFDLRNNNRPLIPSYWIYQDGRLLGLWFFQRVALEDIAVRQFRGRFAVYQKEAGPIQLHLHPNSHRGLLSWRTLELIADPEDNSQFLEKPDRPALPFFARDRFTRTLESGRIATLLAQALRKIAGQVEEHLTIPFVIDAAPGRNTYVARLRILPAVLLLWRRTRDNKYLAYVFHVMDAFVAAEHWGGFGSADSYGVDGDLIAAEILQQLTLALCLLEEEMSTSQREALLTKLTIQGNRFHDLALLNRDYWGGSVLQDHGWRCFPAFAVAALHLTQYIPEAIRWASFSLGRVALSLKAANNDGALPLSSYGRLELFAEPWAPLANTLQRLGLRDPFGQPTFNQTHQYLRLLTEQELLPQWKRSLCFLQAMAFRGQDSWYTQALERALVDLIQTGEDPGGLALAFLWYEEPLSVPTSSPKDGEDGHFFPDSAVAIFGAPSAGGQLRFRLGPPNGPRAWDQTPGPCDRMDCLGGDGHFELLLEGRPFFTTPESPYWLDASTRSRLFIGDSGGRTSIGYPMSIPLNEGHFGTIDSASWNETSRIGRVAVDLAEVYPETSSLKSYHRILEINPSTSLVCTDQIVLAAEKELTWRFQLPANLEIAEIAENYWLLGGKATLTIEAGPLALRSSCHPTLIVSSYTGTGAKFHHILVETLAPTRMATLQVRAHWSKEAITV